MKKLFILLALVAIMTSIAFTQTVSSRDPANNVNSYTYIMTTANAYAQNDKDTLPISGTVWATVGKSLPIGGCSFVSFKYTYNDSALVYFHYDWKLRDSSTWTNAFHDTLDHTAESAGKRVYEKILRDTDTDLMGCVDCVWRVVVQFSNTASKQGVTTPAYKAECIWKP